MLDSAKGIEMRSNGPTKIVFGVFQDGKLVYVHGVTTCTPSQANLIVELLFSNIQLPDNVYFAFDFCAW
jgi:hypothetical protein